RILRESGPGATPIWFPKFGFPNIAGAEDVSTPVLGHHRARDPPSGPARQARPTPYRTPFFDPRSGSDVLLLNLPAGCQARRRPLFGNRVQAATRSGIIVFR